MPRILTRPLRRQPWGVTRVNADVFPGATQIIAPSLGGFGALTNGAPSAITFTSPNAPLTLVGQGGRSHQYRPNTSTISGESNLWDAADFNVGANASMFFYGYKVVTGQHFQLIGYGGSSWGLILRNESTTQVSAKYVDSPTTAAFSATLTGLSAIEEYQPFTVGLVKSGSTISVYCQGRKATTTGGNGGIRRSAGSGLGYSTNADSGSYAGLFLAGITSHVMPDEAMFALLEDPFSVFKNRIFVPGAAAAASTYTLSAATFAPGSITATGVTPRVTVTVS